MDIFKMANQIAKNMSADDKVDLERCIYGVLLAVLALFAVQLLLNRQ